MNVAKTIVDYKKKHAAATPAEICDHVRKTIPGAKTTPGSVACTLNRAGIRAGSLFGADKKEPLPSYSADVEDITAEAVPEESEEDARKRINIRYDAMERMGKKLIAGRLPSLIVSGPPGVGKSWTMVEALHESKRQRHDGLMRLMNAGPGRVIDSDHPDGGYEHPGWYDHISGACTAVGLYHALWNMRNGGVLFLDDCDAVFRDEDALNLLKVATDSTKERLCSWRKNSMWLEEFGIDRTFDFQGHIIFLTNIDFEEVIRRGHKDAEHFKALIDRAAYLCLTLRTARDFMIRIREVAGGEGGFLAMAHGLTKKQVKEILDFVTDNQRRFYNLSLRLVGQIALLMKADPDNWRRDCEATKMRTI